MTNLIQLLKSLGNWNYLWWIPLLILVHAVLAYMSKRNNDLEGNIRIMVAMFVIGTVGQLWVLVSTFSKRLIFDGMLYDNIVFLTYAFVFLMLGCGANLRTHQWLGFALVVFGSILMRLQFK